MRIASGAEALVARVRTLDGIVGYGFTLNFEAIVAREMAAWDALARTRALPFYALFGEKTRERVDIVPGEENAIDPFKGAPLEELRRRAGALQTPAFLAPNGHAWELHYCAALAATLPGAVRIAANGERKAATIAVSDAAGIDIDWAAEPAFASLRWI